MPLSDGNPFVLSRLVPGVAYTGDLMFSRPFDNGGTSSINADGSTGGNEFSLDGSPNMANGRRVAFVPPAGAVQEFKVADGELRRRRRPHRRRHGERDAEERHQPLKGEGYYYMRDEKLSATDFFVNKSGGEKPTLDVRPLRRLTRRPGAARALQRPQSHVLLWAVEWLYDEFPEPGPQTVPTEAMRNGDFSALLAQGIVIYDPCDRSLGGRRLVRARRFPNNIIPAEPHQPDRARGAEFLPAAESGRRRAGPQQLLLRPIRAPTTSTPSRRASITG